MINHNKGYTLLFAVLTAALVLGVAAYIVGIARKQYIISSTSRDSVVALYMADSGIECAIQADLGNVSSTTPLSFPCGSSQTPSTPFVASRDFIEKLPPELSNNYAAVQAPGPVSNVGDPQQYIQFPLRDVNTLQVIACLRMKVWIGRNSLGAKRTVIESRGYNLCDTSTGGPAQSPRTVERAIRLVL